MTLKRWEITSECTVLCKKKFLGPENFHAPFHRGGDTLMVGLRHSICLLQLIRSPQYSVHYTLHVNVSKLRPCMGRTSLVPFVVEQQSESMELPNTGLLPSSCNVWARQYLRTRTRSFNFCSLYTATDVVSSIHDLASSVFRLHARYTALHLARRH